MLHVVVAVLPPLCARGLTLSVVALGDAVGVALAAHITLAAVLHVVLGVSLAPVLLLVVTISPSRAAGVAALAVGASGFGVGIGGALDVTIAAVLYIFLDACLASVVGVVVAVLEPGFAPRISRACNQLDRKRTNSVLILHGQNVPLLTLHCENPKETVIRELMQHSPHPH